MGFFYLNMENIKEKTLCDARKGEMTQIQSLNAEDSVCQRLRELGFCESAHVEKLSDSGTLLCKVCNTKIAISRELAEKIIIKQQSDTEIVNHAT